MRSIARRRQTALWLCLAVVLVATVARTVGPLNPHALALWSLDYRFGFVRRGLAGSLLSLASRVAGVGDVRTLATPASFVAFALWGTALLGVTVTIARRYSWSLSVTMLSCAMLSSSYVVVHGYLVGYPDIATMVFGVTAIGLVVGDGVPPTRWLTAGALLAVATLLHEHALVLIYPTLWLVWFTHGRAERRHVARLVGLAMPVVAGLLLLTSEHLLDRAVFQAAYEARLASQVATQSEEAREIAGFMATSVPEFLREQIVVFPTRLASAFAVWHVWPQIALTLVFLWRARVAHSSTLGILIAIVTLAPWSLHAVAWDTERISTYAILSTWLALWVCSVRFPVREPGVTLGWVAFAVVVINLVLMTPPVDHGEWLALPTRLLMTLPAVFAAAWLARGGRDATSLSGSRTLASPLR